MSTVDGDSDIHAMMHLTFDDSSIWGCLRQSTTPLNQIAPGAWQVVMVGTAGGVLTVTLSGTSPRVTFHQVDATGTVHTMTSDTAKGCCEVTLDPIAGCATLIGTVVTSAGPEAGSGGVVFSV